ncbi:hypothetical protein MCP_2375 [Methanocella paludicola SANAE]|uniref:DUF4097 domain-containing protein n=1 Tax=Methanocella paludicola (strain DSM 17711 / JCM 13418 / NBRC 101707 / SANAE) TaxID=304371 RepID=D1Z175_METPS|nr:DUF4097 family beta strand repeat-containing protein [Methanocella paludicola]BAI62447.1 hypothetical protein MCP_2375 [Methanocella paludicola SANAE]
MKLDKFLLITVGALLVIVLILLAFGGAAFLCLFVTQGPVTNEGPILQKSYDYNGSLSGFDRVNIEVANINGFVDVREGDSDAYAINVNARGTEKDFERYRVEFTQKDENGVKTLKVQIKDTKEPRMASSKYGSDITITLPKSKMYDASLVTVNGEVRLGELDCSKVNMATVNGVISSKANATNATMVTVNGDIDVRTSVLKGDMFLNSVNSAVTVTVPKDAPLSLNAHLVNGGISTDLPLVITEKSRVALVGKTANYTEGIYIETSIVNGDIDIRGR